MDEEMKHVERNTKLEKTKVDEERARQ